jgi:LmbE family N-acetylglucosaminyl deacetylase/SAM-dependent methyltransferase
MVIFDAADPGTLSEDWIAAGRMSSQPALDLDSIGSLVVVAAHPDDETLGAGGLIAEASRRNIPTVVVSVTDGAASHPHSSLTPADVARVRSRELHLAIADLSPSSEAIELGFPDGKSDEQLERLAGALAAALPDGAVIAAPWRGDGHHDHRVVGELCASLAADKRVPLLEYPVWMWHWATPEDTRVPWSIAQSLRLSPEALNSKHRAIARYASQIDRMGDGADDAPILNPQFLSHFHRDSEVFFVTDNNSVGPKDETYFDGIYARSADPWRLSSRWYESRKRAISMASLPRRRYASTLEIGCSVGELTALLADRSDSLLAVDISRAAVDAAQSRTSDQPNVRVEHRDVTVDFPHEAFDLIVLSEVGYYWDLDTLHQMLDQMVTHLSHDGTLLACHWRHPVADYPLTGDQVHDAVSAVSGLHRIAVHREDDFILEVLDRAATSVAAREGFIE